MIGIDPDRARGLAAIIRRRADEVLDVEFDARRAGGLSGLNTTGEEQLCREIDQEFSLLATELVRRADMADGFVIPPIPIDHRRELLDSLFDDEGGQVEMTAPLAYQLLLDNVTHRAVAGPGPNPGADAFDSPVFTDELLRRIADDPSVSPAVAAAARFVADSPSPLLLTHAWEGSGILHRTCSHDSHTLRELQTFLDRNDMLLRLTGPDAAPLDLEGDITDDHLYLAGIDPELFGDLGLPRNGEDLVLSAIAHGTHNHAPLRARSFLETLPIHAVDQQSIDIRRTDHHSVDLLYRAATADLANSERDFVTRGIVISQLPETTTGYRNHLITGHYADTAAAADAQVNEGLPAGHPAWGGNNWFHLGTAASDTVGAAIRNEEWVLGAFRIPPAVRQDLADGNQAIFSSFVEAQRQVLDDGAPSDPLLATGFEFLVAANEAEDPVDRQHLLLASTAHFAVAEQSIVDPYLQLEGASLVDSIGTWAITTVFGNPRSMEEVMTDEGELRIEIDGEHLIDPIPIGEEVRDPVDVRHAIDPDRMAGLLPDGFDWSIDTADDWSLLDQRIPVIIDVAELTLVEPAMAEFVETRASGDLDTAAAWFDE